VPSKDSCSLNCAHAAVADPTNRAQHSSHFERVAALIGGGGDTSPQ
jgi:hypothetical protein